MIDIELCCKLSLSFPFDVMFTKRRRLKSARTSKEHSSVASDSVSHLKSKSVEVVENPKSKSPVLQKRSSRIKEISPVREKVELEPPQLQSIPKSQSSSTKSSQDIKRVVRCNSVHGIVMQSDNLLLLLRLSTGQDHFLDQKLLPTFHPR